MGIIEKIIGVIGLWLIVNLGLLLLIICSYYIYKNELIQIPIILSGLITFWIVYKRS
jgi:hypothetical protein